MTGSPLPLCSYSLLGPTILHGKTNSGMLLQMLKLAVTNNVNKLFENYIVYAVLYTKLKATWQKYAGQ
jgi:hypothetical protein